MQVFSAVHGGDWQEAKSLVIANSREEALELVRAVIAERGFSTEAPIELLEIDLSKPQCLVFADGAFTGPMAG